MLAFRGRLGGIGTRGLVLLKIFAPLLVQSRQDLEFLLEVQFLVLFRPRGFRGFGIQRSGLHGLLLQRRILLHLLLDERSQFQNGHLQQSQRLS